MKLKLVEKSLSHLKTWNDITLHISHEILNYQIIKAIFIEVFSQEGN